MKSIFVSSTFSDMQEERDLLNKFIGPEINEKIKEFNQKIKIIDLRWGVNTENLDSDKGARKVLEVCFDEINKCKPYMLVFIGNRYGWIPDINTIKEATSNYGISVTEPVSVTELEIEFGALQQENLDHVIFCFREDEEENDDSNRIQKLKDKILARKPKHIIYYSKSYEHGKAVLSENLEKDIIHIIYEKVKSEGQEKYKTWQEKEIDVTKNFLQEKNDVFVGRENIIQQYKDKILNSEDCLHVIKGRRGTGKTSIVAKLYNDLSEEENLYIFPFVGGISPNSSSIQQLLSQLNWFLSDILKESYQEDNAQDYVQIRNTFESLIQKFNEKFDDEKKLILLIDAYNLMLTDEQLINYNWFLPNKNLKIFLTISEKFDLPEVFMFDYDELNYIDKKDIQKIINNFCQIHNKTLSDSVIMTILEKENIQNLLYLELVIQRLMMMDQHDLENAINMQDIIDKQIQLVHEMPDDLSELAYYIMRSALEHIEKENVIDALHILAITNQDIEIEHVIKMLNKSNIDVSLLDLTLFIRYMKNCFVEKADGLIGFSNDIYSICFREKIKDHHKYFKIMLNYILDLDNNNICKLGNIFECCYFEDKMDLFAKYLEDLYTHQEQNIIDILFSRISSIVEQSDELDLNPFTKMIDTIFETENEPFVKEIIFKYLPKIDDLLALELLFNQVYECVQKYPKYRYKHEVTVIKELVIIGDMEHAEELYQQTLQHHQEESFVAESDVFLDLVDVTHRLGEKYLFYIRNYKIGFHYYNEAIHLADQYYEISQNYQILKERIILKKDILELPSKILTKETWLHNIDSLIQDIDEMKEKYSKEYLSLFDFYKCKANIEKIAVSFQDDIKKQKEKIKVELQKIEKIQKETFSPEVDLHTFLLNKKLGILELEDGNKEEAKRIFEKIEADIPRAIMKNPRLDDQLNAVGYSLYQEDLMIVSDDQYDEEEQKIRKHIQMIKDRLQKVEIAYWYKMMNRDYSKILCLSKTRKPTIEQLIEDYTVVRENWGRICTLKQNNMEYLLKFISTTKSVADLYERLDQNEEVKNLYRENFYLIKRIIENTGMDERLLDLYISSSLKYGEYTDLEKNYKLALGIYYELIDILEQKDFTHFKELIFNIKEQRIIPDLYYMHDKIELYVQIDSVLMNKITQNQIDDSFEKLKTLYKKVAEENDELYKYERFEDNLNDMISFKEKLDQEE